MISFHIKRYLFKIIPCLPQWLVEPYFCSQIVQKNQWNQSIHLLHNDYDTQENIARDMDHVNYYAYRVFNDCYWTLPPSALSIFSSSPLLQLCTFSFTNRYRSYRPTRALTPTQATIRPSYRQAGWQMLQVSSRGAVDFIERQQVATIRVANWVRWHRLARQLWQALLKGKLTKLQSTNPIEKASTIRVDSSSQFWLAMQYPRAMRQTKVAVRYPLLKASLLNLSLYSPNPCSPAMVIPTHIRTATPSPAPASSVEQVRSYWVSGEQWRCRAAEQLRLNALNSSRVSSPSLMSLLPMEERVAEYMTTIWARPKKTRATTISAPRTAIMRLQLFRKAASQEIPLILVGTSSF